MLQKSYLASVRCFTHRMAAHSNGCSRTVAIAQAGLTVCENLAEGETHEDAVARARELLGGQVRPPRCWMQSVCDVADEDDPVTSIAKPEASECVQCCLVSLYFFMLAILTAMMSRQIPEDASMLEGEGASRPAPADEPWDSLEAPPEKAPYKPQAPPKKQLSLVQIVTYFSLLGAVLSVVAIYLAKLLSDFVQNSPKINLSNFIPGL